MDIEDMISNIDEYDEYDEYDNMTKSFYEHYSCLLYTSPSPRDGLLSRMPSSA